MEERPYSSSKLHSSLRTPTNIKETSYMNSPGKDQLPIDIAEFAKSFVTPKNNTEKLEARAVNLNKSVLIEK